MATSEASLSANSDNPECPFCLNPFTKPKIIICGHIMCRECLITWLKERGMKAGCPLCRHTIFEMLFPDLPVGFLAQLAVNSLPTDYVFMATARGKINITPEMCLYCENLLCSSSSSPNPNCPGQQEALNSERREAEAQEIVRDLSDKVQEIVEGVKKIQKFLKDMEEEFRALVNENKDLLQDQTLRFFGWFQSQTGQLSTVLSTHQLLLKRMQDSRQVVAIILMRKAMHDRVELLSTKMVHLNAYYLRHSPSLRASWRN